MGSDRYSAAPDRYPADPEHYAATASPEHYAATVQLLRSTTTAVSQPSHAGTSDRYTAATPGRIAAALAVPRGGKPLQGRARYESYTELLDESTAGVNTSNLHDTHSGDVAYAAHGVSGTLNELPPEGMTSDKWHDVLEIHRSLGKAPQSHSDAVAAVEQRIGALQSRLGRFDVSGGAAT